jgi:hypothetical protein
MRAQAQQPEALDDGLRIAQRGKCGIGSATSDSIGTLHQHWQHWGQSNPGPQYCSFNDFHAMSMPYFCEERTWREPRQHSAPVHGLPITSGRLPELLEVVEKARERGASSAKLAASNRRINLS